MIRRDMGGDAVVKLETLHQVIEAPPRTIRVWTDALASHGHRVVDEQVPLMAAVAVGAAVHFRSLGVSKKRVDDMFRELLRNPLDLEHSLLVDHRKRGPIVRERAPMSTTMRFHDSKPPIVFDPASFIERLSTA